MLRPTFDLVPQNQVGNSLDPSVVKRVDDAVTAHRNTLIDDTIKAFQSNANFFQQRVANYNNPYIDELSKLVSQKALVNSGLAYSAKGSGYEGFYAAQAAAIYAKAFEMIQGGKGIFSSKVPAELVTSINQLKNDNHQPKDAAKVMDAVKSQKVNDSYTMKGGFTRDPHGHVMVYRFKRTGLKTFNIYIYDASNKPYKRQGGKEKEGKEKTGRMLTRPYMLFEGVTEEELFFDSNPILFENLLTLQNEKYNPLQFLWDNVYKCFAHLSHRLVRGDSDQLPNLFISNQPSGNCTMKSLNCVMLDLVGSHADYKLISLDVRLAILLASFQHFKNNRQTIKDPALYLFQLQSATHNFLTLLNVNYTNRWSSGDEDANLAEKEAFKNGCALAIHLSNEIKKEMDKVDQGTQTTLKMEATYLEQQEFKRKEWRKNNAEVIGKSLTINKNSPPKISPPLNPDLGAEATWKTLITVVADLATKMNRLNENGKTQDLIFQVEAALRNLAHLKQDSQLDLQVEDILSIEEALLNIQKKYSQAIFKMNQVASPASQNTMMEILAISYCLARAADEKYGVLKNYGIYADYFYDFPRIDQLYTIQDPTILHQRNELEFFFGSLNSDKKVLFNFDTQKVDQDEFIAGLKGTVPEGFFYNDYILNDEGVSKELCQLAPKEYRDDTGKAIRGAFHSCFVVFGVDNFPKSLKHIALLKTIALYATEASNIAREPQEHDGERGWLSGGGNSIHIYTLKFWWWFPYDNREQRYVVGKKDFSPNDELWDYSNHEQSLHQADAVLSENTILVAKGEVKQKKEEDEQPFYLALAEPSLQTTMLLNATEDHLYLLEKDPFRLMLEHMFLKLVEGEDRILFSPFFESLKDSTYLKRFESLLAKGKKSFVDTQPQAKPMLNEMLFLLRLYGRALQATCTLNPSYTYSDETMKFVGELISYLNKSLKIPGISESMKNEVHLAKMGLLLGTPLKQLSTELQADFFLSSRSDQHADYFISSSQVKNGMQERGSCADPSFVRECKRAHFYLKKQWSAVVSDPTSRNQFANTLLNRTLNRTGLNLQWSRVDNLITAIDDMFEVWTINLDELSISNSSGNLRTVGGQLKNTPSLQRLFQNKSYELSVFGSETRFQDTVWGQIRVTIGPEGQEWIQRQVKDTWYTYLKSDDIITRNRLVLNNALFYDHALWMDSKNPQHILAYDLSTGKEAYTIENGICTSATTKKRFCLLADEKQYPLIHRFDDVMEINGWVDAAMQDKTSADDVLEYSRFRSQEGNPLYFRWDADKKVWVYPNNPEYHIDTGPDFKIPFSVTSFLPLVNENQSKRKILVPLGKISSGGYQQSAAITLPMQLDEQKGRLCFYEYDVSSDGQLIPHSLEAKVYLAHLYLAQKRYQQAFKVIQSVSISEDMSQTTLKSVVDLLTLAENLKDHSPNACAVRLHVYHIFKTIAPFSKDLEKTLDSISKIYLTYLDGLNHIEHPLLLDNDKEKELLEFLLGSIARDPKFDAETKTIIEERNKFLVEHQLITKTISFEKSSTTQPFIQPQVPTIFFGITKENEQKKACAYADAFFLDLYSSDDILYKSYLDKFDDFRSCYEALKKASSSQDPTLQRVLYKLHTHIGKIDASRRNILFLVAAFPKVTPELPARDASAVQKFLWYKALKEIYTGTKTSKPSLDLSIPEHKTSISTSSITPEELQKPIPKTSSEIHLSRQGQDQLFHHWQGQYLIEQTNQQKKPSRRDTKDIPLKKSEQASAKKIEKHLKIYDDDCEEAYNKTKLVFKKDCDYLQLIGEMENEHKAASEDEKRLGKSIVDLMKRFPTQFSPFVQEQATRLGGKRQDPTLDSILRAASSPEAEKELMKLNPSLSEEEIKEVRSACIEYMIESTHRCHLERIFKPLKTWLGGGKANQTYLEEAQEAMREGRCYIPEKNTFTLLFECLSGWRVKPKQATIIKLVLEIVLGSQDAKLINDIFQQGVIFQQAMGGGKNSVILSKLMEVLSEAGYLSYMMCHHSQFTSVKGNTAHFQKRFSKDVYVLDYSIQDLSNPEILDLILKRLNEAKRKRCAVISKTSFPQVLEAKLIVEVLRLADTKPENRREHMSLIKQLQKINCVLPSEGLGIYDENHINLSIMTDVNIPLGAQMNVKPERAHLIKTIFEILTEPEMRKLIGLEKNLQSELSRTDYDQKVIPFVADKLFDYEPLKLKNHPELKGAFKRFLSGDMTAEDQKLADQENPDLSQLEQDRKENVLFLKFVAGLFYNKEKDIYQQEAANLIGLCRRMMDKVLRISLSKSFNRSYGRDLEYDDGRVAPYLAAGERAETKFFNIYLHMTYEFQAAFKDISEGELTFLMERMTEAANFYAGCEGVAFENTLEAKQFFTLTHVPLEQINNPERAKEALAYINDPNYIKRRLDIEAEICSFHVRYNPMRVCSDSINKTSQFKKAIGCSGTIWNYLTYSKKFGKPLFDKGVEGAILNQMALREEEKGNLIHEIPNYELESFFNVIRNHPNKAKLRGLFDAAGALRDYDEADIALKFLQFFAAEAKKGGPYIEGIIYAHKFSKEQVKHGYPKESFVLLKRGETKPIILKNTTKDEIEKHSVTIDKLFGLLGEPKTTGTDIPFADDGLFFNTVDHKMPMFAALQSFLRARKFFKDQRVELVVSSKARKEMINEGKTFADIKDSLIKNEAMILEEQTSRARIAQIKDVIRSAIIKEIREEQDENKLISLIKKYERFLVDKFVDEPYKQSGRIQGKDKALTILTTYKNDCLAEFEKTNSPNIKAVQDGLKALFEEFVAEIGSDEEMDLTIGEDLETTLEMEQEDQVELELNEETQLELNQEIQTELMQCDFAITSSANSEKKWRVDDVDWSKIEPSTSPILSVAEVLGRTFRNGVTTKEYVPCFPDNLWMSRNFYYTTSEDLPVFHSYSKLPRFVLVVEKEKNSPQFILVSENDATRFKKWMNEKPSEGVYLVDLKGRAEVNPKSLEGKSKEFQEALLKGLWHANLFAGNIEFLEEHATLSKKLILDHTDLMLKFLLLRTRNNSKHLFKLGKNKLFNVRNHPSLKRSQNRVLFSSRRNALETNYIRIRQLPKEEIAMIDPTLVENIAPHQVPWLTTLAQFQALPYELIDSMDPKQLPLLHKDNIPLIRNKNLIQVLVGDDCKKLVENQLKNILPSQVQWIDDAQIDHVSDAILQQVEDGSQVKRFKNKRLQILVEKQIGFTDLEDVPKMSGNQIPWLTDKDRIVRVPPEKAPYIKKEYRPHMESLDAILALPDEDNLTPEQKEKVTNHFAAATFNEEKLKSWHIPYLPNGWLSQLTKCEFIRCIPLKSASTIKQDQAKALNRNQTELISLLEYPAFLGIDGDFVDLLIDKQISKFKVTQEDLAIIKKLNANQAAHLSDDSLQHISQNIVNQLADKEIKRLKNPTLLLEVDEQNSSLLTQGQKEEIKKHVAEAPFNEEKLKSWRIANLPNNWLNQLTKPEFIQRIPIESASVITQDQAKALNRNQTELITLLEYPACLGIDGDLVDLLIDKQISKLDANDEAIIKKLDATQAAHLSDDNLQLISQNIVNLLADKEIKRLQNPSLLQILDETHIGFMDPKNVEKLSDNQIPWLADKDCIAHVPPEKAHLIKKENRHCIESLDGILALPDDDNLSPEQKEKITKHFEKAALNEEKLKLWYIAYLPEDQLSKLTKPEFIRCIPLKSASVITRDQADHLTPKEAKLIAQLEYPAFLGIDRGLIGLLIDKQIGKLDATQKVDLEIIKCLNAEKAAHLSDDSLQYISTYIVNQLAAKEIKRLKNLTLLLEVDEKNSSLLEQEQTNLITQLLDKDNINSTIEIKYIVNRHLRYLDPSKTHLVPAERILHLTDRHWKVLSKEHVRAVYQTIAQQITSAFVGSLNKQALEAVPGHQASWLVNPQIAQLGNEHQQLIQGLESGDSLANLSNSAIQLIKPLQMNSLHDVDFQRVTELSLLLTVDPLDKRLAEAQKRLLIDTVQKQEPDQVLIKHLPLMSNEQARKLSDKKRMAALPSNLLVQLTPGQMVELIPHLHDDKIFVIPRELHNHFSDDQMRTFYGSQFGSRPVQVMQGLAHTMILLPRLIIQLAINAFKLVSSLFLALFSEEWKRHISAVAAETFVHAPARALAGPCLIYDYVIFQRMLLAHTIRS